MSAYCDTKWWTELDEEMFPHFGEFFEGDFTATDWKSMNDVQQNAILMNFRLTYLANSKLTGVRSWERFWQMMR